MPLARRYEKRWDDASTCERRWDVVTGELGAAPILGSGVLATIGIAVGAATIGVPPRQRPVPAMKDEYFEVEE